MRSCLDAAVAVLDRQYQKQQGQADDEDFCRETASARTHNIDAEEVMGMVSAAINRAPNAKPSFISAKIRAQKNATVKFLEELPDAEATIIICRSIRLGNQMKKCDKGSHQNLPKEMGRRAAMKEAAKQTTDRKKLEKQFQSWSAAEIAKEMSISCEEAATAHQLVKGKCTGRKITHVWNVNGKDTEYCGKIEKFKNKKYTVAYWQEPEESYDDAVDAKVNPATLAVDFVFGDLQL